MVSISYLKSNSNFLWESVCLVLVNHRICYSTPIITYLQASKVLHSIYFKDYELFEQNIAWIKPSKYINSCSKSVISSSFNMHTTHSVLQHYNHQVKYWWWFFAPTFYALVFFTKSLHHVYYNTQLFANKLAHFLCFFFTVLTIWWYKPFPFAISKFTNFQKLSKSVTI